MTPQHAKSFSLAVQVPYMAARRDIFRERFHALRADGVLVDSDPYTHAEGDEPARPDILAQWPYTPQGGAKMMPAREWLMTVLAPMLAHKRASFEVNIQGADCDAWLYLRNPLAGDKATTAINEEKFDQDAAGKLAKLQKAFDSIMAGRG